MKITNLTANVLEFNDLGSYIKGVSPIARSIRLDPAGSTGASMYLVETGEVLLSAQSGDIHRFAAATKITVNDVTGVVGAGGSVTLTHNFRFQPNVNVVITASGVQAAASDLTITHNASFTAVTILSAAGAASFTIRLS
jgi:hypothetical protein